MFEWTDFSVAQPTDLKAQYLLDFGHNHYCVARYAPPNSDAVQSSWPRFIDSTGASYSLFTADYGIWWVKIESHK